MPRRSRAIDTEPFAEVMAEALTAYQVDFSYAVAMARQATTIAAKRAVWAVRLALREAEKEAHGKCAEAEPFVCAVVSPCGTGSCPFASGDLARLTDPATLGKSVRPQVSAHLQEYSIESAVRPLLSLRYPGGRSFDG